MESFETHRPHLFALAYRMLGSAMDAEDIVQETYLRYQAAPPGTIRSPRAYLTTVASRLCVDQLQLARRQREVYVGPWLPEPIRTDEDAAAGDPARRAEAQESISLAFLVLLEQLQPFERAVFLLREVFGYEFAEVAAILDRGEAACRRSFSRARLRLRAGRPRFPASPQDHRQLLDSYFRAVQAGDLAALTALLAEDVTLWADGGGKVRAAALRPIHGREAVERLSLGSRRYWPAGYRVEPGEINGRPAMIVRDGDRPFSVLTIDAADGQIRTIWIMVNPEKLARV